MTYLQAVTNDSDTQEETEERPKPEDDGLSPGERDWVSGVPSDPIHRVLFDFHPDLYRNYQLVERKLWFAQHELWFVQRELKSGRLSPEKRAVLKVKRSELRMQVADHEAARAYKITHLLEAESARIQPKPAIDVERIEKLVEAVRLIISTV
ncbi:hypothetical protein [Paraburkholderia sp. GAS348]|uniref:hypothetical protein n=1 Tax=Paraburkholderia sp. GAS348 TaxID=3035132 RepID=UPI003D1F6F80